MGFNYSPGKTKMASLPKKNSVGGGGNSPLKMT
jgi:hypothetical protein